MTGYEVVVDALAKLGLLPDRRVVGPQLQALCPAHEDKRESLSVAPGDDGRALLLCFAGCPTPDVVAALGLEMADLFGEDSRGNAVVDEYIYADEEGRPLIRVQRMWPKSFTQQAWDAAKSMWRNRLGDTRRVPYRLPEVLAAREVWIVEGEKDVERLRREYPPTAERAFTTLLGGAGKWREEYIRYFQGKSVHLIADNDPPDPKTGRMPGIEGTLRIKTALRGVAKGLNVWVNPHGKDATDLLEAGFGLRDLERYTTETDEQFEPLSWIDYEIPETDWLFEPYIPKASRVMMFGPAGSLKSLLAMWMSTKLAEAGHKVAFFELEMRPSETAKRLKKLNPPSDRFKVYRRFSLTSVVMLDSAIELLKGFSLIVIDSWTAATTQMNARDSNQAVARMDLEVFQPLMEETGASLLILDNTGHAMATRDGPVKTEHARGASAKGDKMDITLSLDRPDETDNHMVDIQVKKMRLDKKIPKRVRVRANPAANDIDFRVVGKNGEDLGSLWSYFGEVGAYEAPEQTRPEGLLDRLRAARNAERLEETKLSVVGV